MTSSKSAARNSRYPLGNTDALKTFILVECPFTEPHHTVREGDTLQTLTSKELKRIKTMLLGDKIKELREEHGVLQRQLAALLDIDTPMFSKIERGDRYAKRTQVIQLAEYFNIDKNELLTLWLADKVLDAIEDEDELKRKAIEVAQERIG